MKYLFIFAHPDDETIGSGGTIKLLTEQGHQVRVVLATDGAAGDLSQCPPELLKKYPSVAEIRRHEFKQVCELLGCEGVIWEYEDGEITNQMVWGQLLLDIVEEIDVFKPDVVVTFDHSGWYYHLDHVGVSISATLAVQKAKYPPKVFFHNHFRVDKNKWQYVYSETIPATHVVDISQVKDTKVKSMDLHVSQNLTNTRNHVSARENIYEFYQLVSATEEGQAWLETDTLFTPIAETDSSITEMV